MKKTNGLARMSFAGQKAGGFTLIELLVVIAIIGILSSIVLTNLNSARNKANDTAVKNNLANIRSQASLYYDSLPSATPPGGGGSYGPIDSGCTTGVFSDATVKAQVNAAKTAGGGTPACSGDGTATSQTFAVMSALKSSGLWCVDSSGYSGLATAQANGACTHP